MDPIAPKLPAEVKTEAAVEVKVEAPAEITLAEFAVDKGLSKARVRHLIALHSSDKAPLGMDTKAAPEEFAELLEATMKARI